MTELNSVIESDPYLARAERLMSAHEREAVVDTIAADPEAGVVIPGTGGLRKLRIALQGRGKRGGGRVVYWYRSGDYPAVLLFVVAKNEASDLSPDQRRRFVAIGDAIIEQLGGRR
jgi:hypothetical protein